MREGARDADRIAAASGIAGPTVASLLSFLESIHYVGRDSDGYALQVTVLTEDATPAARRVLTLVRDAMDAWHQKRTPSCLGSSPS